MQVAIPVWNDRVSPVFDSACALVVLEVANGQQIARTEVQLTSTVPPMKAKWLVDHKIDVLICGAISRLFSNMIVDSGISIIPWVCGEFDKVVEAFLADALPHPDFTMPGCCGRRMRARRRGRGGPGGGSRGLSRAESRGRGKGQGRGDGAGRGGGRGRGPRGPGDGGPPIQ